ncbi:MAG: translation initiation factor IF-2 [Bacteroidota bacterium]
MRLSQVAKKLNIGTKSIIEYLKTQSIEIHHNPNIKLNKAHLELLEKEFNGFLTQVPPPKKIIAPVIVQEETIPLPKSKQPEPNSTQTSLQENKPLQGLSIVSKLDLSKHLIKKKKTYKQPNFQTQKKPTPHTQQHPIFIKKKSRPQEINKKKIDPLQKAKYKKEKKERLIKAKEKAQSEAIKEQKILRVTSHITAHELSSLMDIPINQLLSTCMELGIIASMNQRLDPETIVVVADELGFQVEFVTNQITSQEEKDAPENLLPRSPIVTVMGHVDHGKTSLLDHIRKAQVAQSEAGSITQHIGAYEIHTKDQKRVVFLDTPGHEAFTAMRARGVELTDIAIIIIAADDGVMPQTKEAISHAQLAGTPIVIAINKIDKQGANPQKIKDQLAQINVIVEEWGGKYQCQEISAKKGLGIEDLLEKILIEADMLSLKANPNKKANGLVIESSLDQGRGYLTTVMVKGGTLQQGDTILAGSYYGKVKAMFSTQGTAIKKALPATPIQILGLNGAPNAGQNFLIVHNKRIAKEEAAKNKKIILQQKFKVQLTSNLAQMRKKLDTGTIPEINILIKGDVDGSIEALADALLKLSTDHQVQIKIIYKAVGQISESDIILASASQAIIIGFQTKLTPKARVMSVQEKVEVILKDIIYDAVEHIKATIEALLKPEEKKEIIISKAEVIETFSIPDIGTIAGCKVLKGNIKKEDKVTYKRKNKVLYNGFIKELQQKGKTVQQAKTRSEFAISFENFHDISVGDTIEVSQD